MKVCENTLSYMLLTLTNFQRELTKLCTGGGDIKQEHKSHSSCYAANKDSVSEVTLELVQFMGDKED